MGISRTVSPKHEGMSWNEDSEEVRAEGSGGGQHAGSITSTCWTRRLMGFVLKTSPWTSSQSLDGSCITSWWCALATFREMVSGLGDALFNSLTRLDCKSTAIINMKTQSKEYGSFSAGSPSRASVWPAEWKFKTLLLYSQTLLFIWFSMHCDHFGDSNGLQGHRGWLTICTNNF